jgi:signal transduction histidine kinase/ligand-binding sensor domain-containing protein
VLIASLLLASAASAQQFSIASWGHKDGLPSTSVFAVTQTPDGFLWLGTGDGLIRFDGFQFVRPELPDADRSSLGEITALCPMGSAGLVIGTSSGLLTQWDGSTVLSIKLDSPVERIRALPDQTLEVETHYKLFRAAHTDLAIISATQLPQPHSPPVSAATAQEPATIEERPDKRALSDISRTSTIRKTLRDTRDALWVATESHGLFRIAHGGEVQQFTRSAGLPSDHVRDVFEDREGNLWAGTQNGLARLRQDKFVTYTTRNGLLSDTATALAPTEDDGVWVGSRSGLQHFRTSDSSAESPVLEAAVIDVLALPGGGLLIATDTGLRKWGQREIPLPPALSEMRQVEQLAASAEGDVWLYGRQAGLWHYQPDAQPESIDEPALAGHVVTSMKGGQSHDVWLGLENGNVIQRPPAGSHIFTAADGLTGGAVHYLSPQPDGTLWVATDGGLAYFDGERFRHWDRLSGLPGDRTSWAVPDPHGNLWVGYSTGIARVGIDALLHASFRGDRVRYRFYDDGDGLKSNPESHGGSPVALTSSGRLWVSMSEGVSMIDPTNQWQAALPPPVHILELTADERRLAALSAIKVPANTRTLQITYTAISLTEPRKVRFRYRLEGFDPAWHDAGIQRRAFYTNLPPGHYRFQVRATNADAIGNPTGDSIDFELLSAFYQTAGFRVLCGLVGLSLVYVGYRLRLRFTARELQARYEERMAERTRIAQNLHDNLVQEMLGISLQLEIADAVTPSESEAKGPLHRALKLSQEALADGRGALRVLRQKPFGWADIESTLRDTAQSMTGSRESLRFITSGIERPIRASAAEELVPVVREALRNAMRHAAQGEISVHGDYGKQDLVLKVRDSGPGIGEELLNAGRPGHFGIAGMRERAARIRSSLEVNTSATTGTQWTLRVPASIAYEPEDGLIRTRVAPYRRWLNRLLTRVRP